MKTTKIGVIAEGATDYRFLRAILKRIAKERVGINWPVRQDDFDDKFRIRKTGYGGIVAKVNALVKDLKVSPREHSFYVVLFDRKTNDARAKVKKIISASDGLFAIGVAIEEIEAWVLADRNPLTKWLELKSTDMPGHKYWNTGYSPENDSNPKKTLDELTCYSSKIDSRYGDGNTSIAETYAELWENCVDLRLLETMCPKGFKPFCNKLTDRFRAMLITPL